MQMNTGFTLDLRSASWRALVASVVWLRVGFIGASTLMIGLIMLFTGEARPLYAFAGAIAGGVVAALAWRRSWVVLTYADESTAAGSRAASVTPSRSISQTSRSTSSSAAISGSL